MAGLISKIQHKTYEKGEFTDEKERSLTDTIKLIETFPWDAERTLTDIQLTGPSVTIRDEDINYLKVGLYFNGKFCLYYLDRDNHLYEFHTAEMQQVEKLVTDFYNKQLDLSSFDKHLFNVGSKAHFETCYFEYREKLWRILMLTSMLLFYAIFFVVIDVTLIIKNPGWLLCSLFSAISLGYYFFIFRIYYNAFVNRNNYLQISRANNVFSFGYNDDSVNTYLKTDIHEIIYYQTRGSKNPNMVEAFELTFKNGDSIKFTNMLIGSFDFQSKFYDSMGNATRAFTNSKKGVFKVL